MPCNRPPLYALTCIELEPGQRPARPRNRTDPGGKRPWLLLTAGVLAIIHPSRKRWGGGNSVSTCLLGSCAQESPDPAPGHLVLEAVPPPPSWQQLGACLSTTLRLQCALHQLHDPATGAPQVPALLIEHMAPVEAAQADIEVSMSMHHTDTAASQTSDPDSWKLPASKQLPSQPHRLRQQETSQVGDARPGGTDWLQQRYRRQRRRSQLMQAEVPVLLTLISQVRLGALPLRLGCRAAARSAYTPRWVGAAHEHLHKAAQQAPPPDSVPASPLPNSSALSIAVLHRASLQPATAQPVLSVRRMDWCWNRT